VCGLGQDRTALAVAAKLEEVLGGFTPPPGFDTA
jgi:hypothetical protein